MGIVVGDSGTILQTTNQGNDWHRKSSPVSSHIKNLDVLNERKIFCVGDNGTILKSNDKGETWSIVLFDNSEPLVKIRVFNNSKAYVLSKNKVLYGNENIVGQKINSFDHQLCKVHPNPFCNIIYLSDISHIPTSIKIHSIDGRAIFYLENFADDKLQLNTSRWEKGIYVVSLSTDEYSSSFKMIK